MTDLAHCNLFFQLAGKLFALIQVIFRSFGFDLARRLAHSFFAAIRRQRLVRVIWLGHGFFGAGHSSKPQTLKGRLGPITASHARGFQPLALSLTSFNRPATRRCRPIKICLVHARAGARLPSPILLAAPKKPSPVAR